MIRHFFSLHRTDRAEEESEKKRERERKRKRKRTKHYSWEINMKKTAANSRNTPCQERRRRATPPHRYGWIGQEISKDPFLLSSWRCRRSTAPVDNFWIDLIASTDPINDQFLCIHLEAVISHARTANKDGGSCRSSCRTGPSRCWQSLGLGSLGLRRDRWRCVGHRSTGRDVCRWNRWSRRVACCWAAEDWMECWCRSFWKTLLICSWASSPWVDPRRR